ncbi:MAG: tRNA pseudouridine(38-40) synthase TruA [Acholeplasmatales bacterium]|nr:tRNA pseudouridine(38-40) synthase TruA [Acholeplasmatales bacterium]
MRVKLTISYDGFDFMGYQVQDDLRTVESELELALRKVCGKDIKTYASGRTDRGVHALGQVVHFDTEKNISKDGWQRALNSFLPLDIRVVDVEMVSPDFHARFSAKKKEYHYLVETADYNLFQRRYKAFYYNLDIDLMKEALKRLCGTHSFKGFCSASNIAGKDFVKTLDEAYIIEEGTTLRFVFKGSGFLKYQIRRMMGIVLEIGRGRDTLDTIDKVFMTEDPTISRMCADPQGLYLVKVYY